MHSVTGPWRGGKRGPIEKSRPHFKLITRRHVHSLDMQIGTDSFYVVILTLTLEYLNSKSVGFDKLTRTIIMIIPIGGFRFIVLTFPHNHTNTHTHTHTHTHHDKHDKVIAVSAPPYYVVGADNYLSTHVAYIYIYIYIYMCVCVCV